MEAKENKRDVKTKDVKKTEQTPVNESLIGNVTGCEHLYVRSKADVNSDYVGIIKKDSEVEINEKGSTEDFYKVKSEVGSGYCMKKYIKVK